MSEPVPSLFISIMAGTLNVFSLWPNEFYISLNYPDRPTHVPRGKEFIALCDEQPADDDPEYMTRQWAYTHTMEADNCNETSTTVKMRDGHIPDLDDLQKYYIARISGSGKCEEFSKFKRHRKWMGEANAHIGDKRLHEIMIPGSHDAGTYTLSDVSKVVEPYASAQYLDFKAQLHLGMRYFDCRLKYFASNDTDHFWFHHGVIATRVTLADLIDATKRFLQEWEQELVILDFSHFEDADKNAIIEFQDRLVEAFGDWIITRQDYGTSESAPTINEYLDAGKRVLVLCDECDAFKGSINQFSSWPNTSDVSVMVNKLTSEFGHSGYLRCAQGILTPGSTEEGFSARSLQGLAVRANAAIRTEFLRDTSWRTGANVLMVDHPQTGQIVDLAIWANKAR